MLPKDFVSPFPKLEQALNEEPSVSVRVNIGKGVALPAGAAAVPWCRAGFWLDSRPQFTWDPALHQGLYYVQDASSMIASLAVSRAVEAIGATAGVLMLDACAAPGGKTTAAIDALPAGSFTVANEYVPTRAAVLAENLAKWGTSATMVTRGDTARFRKLRGMFDIILADVPCSGEGMFRKDAEAVSQWSPALVAECAARQREIVANLWEALRPGGIFIYSTCTFNRDENEDMLAWLLDNYPEAQHMPLNLPDEWDTITTDGCTHFVPGYVRGEGLTIFMVSKDTPTSARSTAASSSGRAKGKGAKAKATLPVPKECFTWIERPDDYEIANDGTHITAIPAQWSGTVKTLAAALSVVVQGLELATVKGRDAIPGQQLALSTALRRGTFPEVDVEYATAIAYLRRDSITLPDGTPRGFVLLTYASRPLGFVKNIGSRANNLYPADRRILSTHVPDTPPTVI
jgi:16S rRNA C967 or C1407 C5-methylase (RsmB/RsmF family)/NOL1/NOP2/fmu family ribosome biogenesis protein